MFQHEGTTFFFVVTIIGATRTKYMKLSHRLVEAFRYNVGSILDTISNLGFREKPSPAQLVYDVVKYSFVIECL